MHRVWHRAIVNDGLIANIRAVLEMDVTIHLKGVTLNNYVTVEFGEKYCEIGKRCQVTDAKTVKETIVELKIKNFLMVRSKRLNKTAVAMQRVLEALGKFGMIKELPGSLEYRTVLGSD